ncbi:MAG TPA: nickel-type superoxide dismutase maturation protease [Nitriliruptorales bacterium]
MGTNGRNAWTWLSLGLGAAYLGALAVNRSLRDVQGRSMSPALEPGDRILVAPVPPARVRRGAVVVVRDPRMPDRCTVKRLRLHTEDGLVVLGDNPSASTDSRSYGAVPYELYVGQAVWRVRPWGAIPT